MLKGRKLTTSQSERLLGIHGGHAPAAGDSLEFGEDDVWSVVGSGVENNSRGSWFPHSDTESVPMKSHDKRIGQQDGLDTPRVPCHVSASEPVNVPDWSKIHRADYIESLHDLNGYKDHKIEVIPPHEYLALQYGRIATNSVFEGAGRTLKGRDMSRVRDSVWGCTGFDG